MMHEVRFRSIGLGVVVCLVGAVGCDDSRLPSDVPDDEGASPQALACDGRSVGGIGWCAEDEVCDRATGACVSACANRCGALKVPTLASEGPASVDLDCGGCAGGATCQADNVCRAPSACDGLEINGFCCSGGFASTALPTPPAGMEIQSIEARDGYLLIDYSNTSGAELHTFRLYRYGEGGAGLSQVLELQRVFALGDDSVGSRGLGLGHGELIDLSLTTRDVVGTSYTLTRSGIDGDSLSPPATYTFDASSAALYNPRFEHGHPTFYDESRGFVSMVYRDDNTLSGAIDDGRAGAHGEWSPDENDFAWCAGTGYDLYSKKAPPTFACERAFWYARPVAGEPVREEAIPILEGPDAYFARGVLVGRYSVVSTMANVDTATRLLVDDLADDAAPTTVATYDDGQWIQVAGLIRQGLPWVLFAESPQESLGLLDLSDPMHPTVAHVTTLDDSNARVPYGYHTQFVVDQERHVAFAALSEGVVIGLPTCTSL